MLSTQYAVQFRFKERGHWYTGDVFDELHLAQIHLRCYIDNARSNPKLAQFWRIAKREVSEWEEVK